MTARTSTYTLLDGNIGYRGHHAASVHTTEGRGLAFNAGILKRWLELWHLPNIHELRYKPVLYQKVGGPGGTNLRRVWDTLREAKALGYLTVLQVRDNEPLMRSVKDATTIINQYYPSDHEDIHPHVINYGNERVFNNTGVTIDVWAERVADIHEVFAKKDQDLYFAGPACASWSGLYEEGTRLLAKTGKAARRRLKLACAHHYRGRPTLAEQLDYANFVRDWWPGARVCMGEGGFTSVGQTNDAYIQDERSAGFVVLHALSHAQAGIDTCHYTLQNNENIIQEDGGNGMFTRLFREKPSARGYIDFVSWLLRARMKQVTRDYWDDTGVYANEHGRIVAARHFADPQTDVSRFVQMSAKENDTSHVVMADILLWVSGQAAQPSYAPLWEPDWDAVQDVYDTSVADLAATSKTVTVNLDRAYKAFTYDGATQDYIYYTPSGYGRPTATLTSPTTLSITLPQAGVLRGTLTG